MTIEAIATATRLISGEMFAALGDIGPCELVEGRIVAVTPPGFDHGEIEFAIGTEIRRFVREHNLGRVSGGEAGIYTRRNPDTVRGADVIFISNERYAQRTSASYLDVAPDLIVEVLSPNDRWSEVTAKLQEYFAIGVRLVWLVDPQQRRVHAYRALTEVALFTEEDTLPGEDVLPGFSMSLADIFAG